MGLFGDLPVVKLTDAAVARVKAIVAASATPLAGLRLGLEKGGCAGMTYTFTMVETPDPRDDVVAIDGVQVFVDPSATLFLLGTTVDFQTTKMASTFVFENPNQVSACGCGESVAIEPAKV
ncbi:iron-sulfur cluster assembly accessory protein [Siculibacillus lacustris]|uniref:Iron-sulfur cluster assembly accessory protein n=1 Tax=Siculibacillus lacustris TaxID=1549641 RepID=A0A4Q9VS61_9HYPH|nr:iron-sulfur cluster assembly accessory protein [Siculibacillus lacustris]TBW38463.1 iron-sulfur cluster assembly accessory protein [Siculibacillus lacustris]